MSEKNEKLEKVLDVLGEILAFLTIALYAVLIVNGTWEFIPQGNIYNILLIAKNYAALAVVIVVGLEAVIKRSFIIKLLFIILVAVVIIFQFFPGTWDSIVQMI